MPGGGAAHRNIMAAPLPVSFLSHFVAASQAAHSHSK
jgi:hypothetical protein